MALKTNRSYRIAFITLGCAKNEVDTADMQRNLIAAGYLIEEDVQRADAIIVNTCSFIQAATEESLEAIFEVADLERIKEGRAHLIVAGCMPSRYGNELETELTEARLFVPCNREDDIVEILDNLFVSAPISLEDATVPSKASVIALQDSSKGDATGTSPISVYVKISDGCSRFCSFCTIPFIRGRYRSYSLESIMSYVDERIAEGAREIVFIAQDTGRWGDDFAEPSSLAELMAIAAQTHPDTWFRVMYIQPEGVTDELLDCVAQHTNIAPYFDVPLQHANQDILRAMNRKGSSASYEELVAKIRCRVPNAIVRTTLIVGFPGETSEQFEELCDFLEQADLDYVGSFAYSREDGTKAAKLSDQIDDEIKQERLERLRDIADSLSCARVADRIGSIQDVLVLGREEDGQLYGRAICQAPDVDGVTYLDKGEPGEIVKAKIVDTLLYEMEGEVCD